MKMLAKAEAEWDLRDAFKLKAPNFFFHFKSTNYPLL